jgi:hypothetical protein
VNASTVQRILIGIGAFLAAGMFLLFLTGDRQAAEVARQLLVVVITLGGLFWLVYRFRVLPRRESFQGQAAAQAFRAQVGDPLGLLDLPFTLFRWVGSVRQIENTATGIHDGREVVVADYWFAPTGSSEYDDYERYTCVVTVTPSGWSDLAVVPERFGSRLRDAIGSDQLGTESEAFNRTFDFRGADRRFASAFVDARMMQWILDQPPGTGFEVLGGRLMVFRPRAISSLDDVARAVQLFDAFMEHVPRVVRAG